MSRRRRPARRVLRHASAVAATLCAARSVDGVTRSLVARGRKAGR